MTRCPVVCPLNQFVASLGSWHKNAITVDSWILLGSSQETIPDCGLNKGSSKSDKLRQAVSHCSFKIRVCPCKHVELIKDILKVYHWYLSSSCLPQLTILGYLMVSPLVWRNPSRWPAEVPCWLSHPTIPGNIQAEVKRWWVSCWPTRLSWQMSLGWLGQLWKASKQAVSVFESVWWDIPIYPFVIVIFNREDDD